MSCDEKIKMVIKASQIDFFRTNFSASNLNEHFFLNFVAIEMYFHYFSNSNPCHLYFILNATYLTRLLGLLRFITLHVAMEILN